MIRTPLTPAAPASVMSSWQSLFHLSPEQRRHHRIHLVGIGGTGLAPIAQVLREMGFQVSGSDQAPSPRTETLAAQEVRVGIGHDVRHLFAPDAPRLPDLVLVSSAIAGDNPEIKAAASEGIAVVKRKDLLGPLTAGRRVIAVAGTHRTSPNPPNAAAASQAAAVRWSLGCMLLVSWIRKWCAATASGCRGP